MREGSCREKFFAVKNFLWSTYSFLNREGSCVEKIPERKKLIGKYLQFQGGGSDEVYRLAKCLLLLKIIYYAPRGFFLLPTEKDFFLFVLETIDYDIHFCNLSFNPCLLPHQSFQSFYRTVYVHEYARSTSCTPSTRPLAQLLVCM